MKVEHVLLFLVGAFLVYHMICNCGRVEGLSCGRTSVDEFMGTGSAGYGRTCADVRSENDCIGLYENVFGFFLADRYNCEWDNGQCKRGSKC